MPSPANAQDFTVAGFLAPPPLRKSANTEKAFIRRHALFVQIKITRAKTHQQHKTSESLYDLTLSSLLLYFNHRSPLDGGHQSKFNFNATHLLIAQNSCKCATVEKDSPETAARQTHEIRRKTIFSMTDCRLQSYCS